PNFMRSISGENFIGLHITFFTITALVSRPFSGKLTDTWGRRPMKFSPLMLLIKLGSSGSTMLNEPKKSNELMESNQKFNEYFFIQLSLC
ncbi:MAG: hypothetical protein AAFY41_12375, partial [Bacteroidota bacterium]